MNLNILPGQTICLGFQTENLVEAVVFDKTAWVNEYGPGTFEFVHKRRQDSDALPIAVNVSGGVVTWPITTSDVAYRGMGEAQLRYYNAAGQIKASEIYRTQVARSLVSDTDVPEPYEGWVEQVLAAAAGIQNMLVDADTLPPGSAATVTKTVDPETGVVTLSFGLPEGIGIASMTVLPSGEWKVIYNNGTEEIVGEDVYSAMHALEQAAERAKEAAELAQSNAEASAAAAYRDAERAEQAATTAGYLDVDIVDGDLIYIRTDAVDVDFSLLDGDLVMEVI